MRNSPAGARNVRVNRQIVGFKKIKFYTMENVGAGKLSMPEQEMHTTAFWLHFPAAFLARFAEYTPAELQSGISGLGNALRTVAALLLMCDPRDLGVAMSEEVSATFEPNLITRRVSWRRDRAAIHVSRDVCSGQPPVWACPRRGFPSCVAPWPERKCEGVTRGTGRDC